MRAPKCADDHKTRRVVAVKKFLENLKTYHHQIPELKNLSEE